MVTPTPTPLTALPTSIGPTPTPLILAGVFVPIAVVAVGLRFYCRRLKGAPLQADDWIILPGLLFAVGQAVILVLNACIGDLGKHQALDAQGDAIPSPKLMTFQELEYASFLTFVPALLFAKLSLLHLYNRIFHVHSEFRVAVRAMYALNVAWGAAFFASYVFKCWPIQQYWETANEKGHCLPNSVNYAFAFSNVILDLAILVMPLPVVWSLNMASRQKWAVSGIFMLGSTVVILSIAKAVAFFYTFEWVQHDHDIMWDEAPLFYFSVPEALVAVTSACLPTLRPLFRKMSVPLTSSVSSATLHASAAASKTVIRVTNSVELSRSGMPMRKQSQRNCASPNGLGRERGLGVSRKSMAGGVMWEWYTRRGNELAAGGNYMPWKRDSDYLNEYSPKTLSNGTTTPESWTLTQSSSEEEQTIGSKDGPIGLGLNTFIVTPPTPTARRAPSPLGMIAFQASYYQHDSRARPGSEEGRPF